MKMKPLIIKTNERHECDQRAGRDDRHFPQIEQNYQTTSLGGTCGTPAKFRGPAFYELSNKYFAEEAPRGFALDAAVFTVLILTAVLPIVNSIQAVAALVQSANFF
jgi:hypothetical protein